MGRATPRRSSTTLRVTNQDSRAHTVHVLLFDGDSLAHWASQQVPAADDEGLGTATFEGYPPDLEPTRLLARRDEQTSAATQFDFTAHDADCLGLRLEIGEQRPDPHLVVWYTGDPCENETATAE
ncbi:hypothetical protein SAMN04488065_0202 [Haloplanus vescus]|uniref:Uncharacterized protein n=1 Tax=Haloplanus vescus TaxID=555874 RepID=A0A1H3VRF1_9EURY|nr:hypothetical protein SAMN04488065_0202 [Haloplanus vescus]